MQDSLDPAARIILGLLTLLVLASALLFPVREDRSKDDHHL